MTRNSAPRMENTASRRSAYGYLYLQRPWDMNMTLRPQQTRSVPFVTASSLCLVLDELRDRLLDLLV